jgi:hypothetical protein
MDCRYICILIVLFIFIFIYLTMMGYTIYKLNNKVNQINDIFVNELDLLHQKTILKEEKREKRERKKREKNISN